MIRFPRTLQQIHIFEKDGVWYVAHLQAGDVLQIDSITADILALCSTEDNVGILEKLGDKYAEGQILESLSAFIKDAESKSAPHNRDGASLSALMIPMSLATERASLIVRGGGRKNTIPRSNVKTS